MSLRVCYPCSVDRLFSEACLWVPVWRSGQLTILEKKEETRRWRFMCPRCPRWISFTRTLPTSKLTCTHTSLYCFLRIEHFIKPALSVTQLFKATKSQNVLTVIDVNTQAAVYLHTCHVLHVDRTLPFNEFVKRASEKKHSDFFLCEVRIRKHIIKYTNVFF